MQENIKTTFTSQELKKLDQNMHQEDLGRQEKLRNQPNTNLNKEIIAVGKKSPEERTYTIKTAK